MRRILIRWCMLTALLGAGLAVPPTAAAKVVIKLGTLAPDGSPWHLILKDMAEQWREASGGEVVLRIFPGGIAGDEQNMVRKMGIGQLQASMLTIVGLSRLAPAVQILSVPEMFASYDELDHVRDQLAPRLERQLAERGYVVLHWADGGWIRFFSTVEAKGPADIKRLKLFVSTDQETVDIWKDLGFTPVALAATDILSSLQTGMIDAAPMPAAGALSLQLFSAAKHMLDFPWAPLTGATVIEASRWAEVPADLRPRLLAIAAEAGVRLRREVRRLDAEAVASMKERGLVVHPVTEEIRRAWQDIARLAYPRIRRDFVGPEIFDAALASREAYRAAAGRAGGTKASAERSAVPRAIAESDKQKAP